MGIPNPLDMAYAQMTLPSSRSGSPHAHQLQQLQHGHSPHSQQLPQGHSPPRFAVGDNKVIYSQIDVSRRKGGTHSGTNSYSACEDPQSWAPLLRSRNQPESAL